MKVKRLQISAELLFEMFSDGFHEGGYTVIKDAVPADARLVNVRYFPPHGWPNSIELLIESDSFAEVAEGHSVPTLLPIARKEYPEPHA